jgi:hypothetical protein
MLTCRVLSLFCSNPEDFGIEGGEKDPIFDSLKNITKLPSSPPKDDDRLDYSAAQTVVSPSAGRGKVQEENMGENSPATGEAEDLVEKPHAGSACE